MANYNTSAVLAQAQATGQKYNKNGQLIPADKPVDYGTNTAEQQAASNQSLLKTGKGTGLAQYETYADAVKALNQHGYGPSREAWEKARKSQGFTADDTPKGVPSNSINPKDYADAGLSYDDYLFAVGKLPAQTGGGRAIMSRADWEKAFGKKEVTPTNTTTTRTPTTTVTSTKPQVTTTASEPKNTVTQDMKDLTKEEVSEIKDFADSAVEWVDDKDLQKKSAEKIANYMSDVMGIDTHEAEDYARGIISSYLNGDFGKPESRQAKQSLAYYLIDTIGTTISNIGKVADNRGSDIADDKWTTLQNTKAENAMERRNQKFTTELANAMGIANLAATDQEELEKQINSFYTQTVFGTAAKRLNNIEDSIGLFNLYKQLGENWKSLSSEDQWAIMGAWNALRNGKPMDAAEYLNHFDTESMANLLKNMQSADLSGKYLANAYQGYANQLMQLQSEHPYQYAFMNALASGIGSLPSALIGGMTQMGGMKMASSML